MSQAKKIIKKMKVKNELARQVMGEILGTFVLLLFGCAAAAQVKTSRETKGQYLSVNMAFSIGVMSAMYLSRAVSGAHLNPAVSLSFCVLGDLAWIKLLPYSLAQILGAYLASALVYLIYYDAIMDFSGGVLTVFGPNETASIFATYPTDVVSTQTNFLDQVVGTAMLMLCILPLNDKRNAPAPEALLPPIVATVVLGISMSMSANCGAAINPARDLGPRLFTFTAGWGTDVFTALETLVPQPAVRAKSRGPRSRERFMAAINPACDLGPRLFTFTAGWGTDVFTCYDYFFWIPLVAPMVGGVLGSIIYLVFIQWHLPELEEDESESEESKDQTKVLEHNNKKDELYLKMSSL